jgi:hypothetical protein
MPRDTPTTSILVRLVPIVIVAAVAVALVILVVLVSRDPDVDTVAPLLATPGRTVEIRGAHFGDSVGRLVLSGHSIPASSINSWADGQVTFTLPDTVPSGLLYVVTDRGSSRGVLLQVEEDIPSAGGREVPGAPSIDEISTTEVTIGSVITIEGRDFGRNQRNSVVEFPGVGYSVADGSSVRSYPHWSDSRIRVRVPDGVIDGFVRVVTEWGASNPVRITVARPAGVIERQRPHEIAFRYALQLDNVTVRHETEPGLPGDDDIVVILPRIVPTFEQGNIRVVHEAADGTVSRAVRAYETVRYESVTPDLSDALARTVVLDRYEVAAAIDPSRISAAYETESGFYEYYTRPLPHLPTDSDAIREIAAQLLRNRANPYRIALAAYEWTLDTLTYAATPAPVAVPDALSLQYGDDFTYASMFVTLCRASGVPARVVGGIILPTDRRAYPHYWSEVFIPAFGWFPVDPGLGDEGFPGEFPIPENPRDFYFGGLDAHRVTFQRGYDASAPTGEAVTLYEPIDPYSLQRVYLEAGAAVESVDVTWEAPRAIALYPREPMVVDSR